MPLHCNDTLLQFRCSVLLILMGSTFRHSSRLLSPLIPVACGCLDSPDASWTCYIPGV